MKPMIAKPTDVACAIFENSGGGGGGGAQGGLRGGAAAASVQDLRRARPLRVNAASVRREAPSPSKRRSRARIRLAHKLAAAVKCCCKRRAPSYCAAPWRTASVGLRAALHEAPAVPDELHRRLLDIVNRLGRHGESTLRSGGGGGRAPAQPAAMA
eukprot:6989281-Prymnesium_polylepis.2